MTRQTPVLLGCAALLTLSACASTRSAQPDETPAPAPQPAPEAPATPGTQPVATPGATLQVTGAVRYRERIALSPEAVVQVEVVELMPDGTAGTVLGEQTLRNAGQVPIAFSVAIPQERIRPEATYGVRARITDAGRSFSTPAPVPAITQGSVSSDVQVLLRVGG
ncbi:YbaY family lipoprotein [Hyalangium gracile]|uniref:YbaY family lipoprotein n=1 Tax=Hyalangium gracile TaxID=394092 RepID=UPI001CCAA00A|nr:YbaY family lipoprotein [Hyalangium gracile]